MSHTAGPPVPQPVVRTAGGLVRGVWRPDLGTTAAFLGIPFAEPPVGELRFAAPVPRAPWEGIRDATRPAATAQRRPFAEVTAIPEPSLPGEDILHVDVFTPAPGDPSAQLPVLFWIHGGGFKAGVPSSPWYDGFAFNRDGVVTVSVGYRLGFDGFGSIEGAPANRGLLDQIEGLRWLQRNIAAFGGDPGAVTIAGQSAGGGSVLALLASPSARGLFHGAICHSGALAPVPDADARARSARLAELCGVPATLEGFRSLSEEAVLDATAVMEAPAPDAGATPQQVVDELFAGTGIGGLQFVPQVDEASLPADWVAAVAASGIPLLMGSVAHEFSFVGRMIAPALAGSDPVDLLRAGPLGDLADEYAAAHPELSGALLVGQALTDATFRQWVPVVATARDAARPRTPDAGARTWAYDFRWPNATNGLVTHCAELPFAWDHLGAERVDTSCGPDAPQTLADAMHGAWVRFIRTHEAPWTPWRPDAPRAMVFDTTSGEADAYALEARVGARLRGVA